VTGVTGRQLLLTLGLFLGVGVVVVGLTVLGLRLAGHWAARHPADFLAILMVELYLALLTALLLVFRPAGLRDRLGFRFTSPAHLGLALGLWVGALVVGTLATAALTPLLGRPQSNAVGLLSRSFDPLFVALIVPTVCLLAPACEEMLFRGVLYGWLRRYLPALPVMVITAAVFAAAHLLPSLFPILFAFGLAAAVVREWTGSTLNSFVMHVTQNTASVAVTYAALTHHL
jgi:membrane protease YdiL (CAAX protease family)